MRQPVSSPKRSRLSIEERAADKAAQKADCVVLLTEWNEFRALDLKKLAKKMTTARMADLRNIYSAKDAKKAGFEGYVSVGR